MQQFISYMKTIFWLLLLWVSIFVALKLTIPSVSRDAVSQTPHTGEVRQVLDKEVVDSQIQWEKTLKEDADTGFYPKDYLTFRNLEHIRAWENKKINDLQVELEWLQQEVAQDDLSNNLEFEEKLETPQQILHDVPFFAQAPMGDWNQPWQDACEEASIILGAYWLKNKPLTKQKFIQEIQYLVQLQNTMFGSYVDTTIDQTKTMYDRYYGIWTTSIIDQPSIQDLKEQLAQWHLIVAPFAGKKLWNPYYSNGWPRYHMMLIVGYDETHFITHDVGTRHGQNFRYTHHVIIDALHDFVPISAWDISHWVPRALILQK